MKKTSTILAVAVVLLAAARSNVSAQTQLAPVTRGFFNFDVGGQTQTRTIATTQTQPVFGETATVTTNQQIGKGVLLGVSGGYRVWRNLAVGVGVTWFNDKSDASVVATIPNPLVFDQPTTVNLTQSNLSHSETGVHIMAVYFIPITDKIDASISVGPSFIHVHQDYVVPSIPAGTQTVNLSTASTSGTANGANVGADINYFFTKTFGAGFFLRWAGGSVDLNVPTPQNLSVGGFQFGVGARVHF
jgi:hypothetical protein